MSSPPQTGRLDGLADEPAEAAVGVYSEVGRLRTVMVHRPGAELRRLTPRNWDKLLFDGMPWVSRAQDEHDEFADVLRSSGVEVLYVGDLLAQALESEDARRLCIEAVVADPRHGDTLAGMLRTHLSGLHPQDLAEVLVAGVAHEELRAGRGLVYSLMGEHDFVVDPLPNLLFTRDSSTWIGQGCAVTSPAMPARRREATLVEAIYRHHPRFVGTEFVYTPELEALEGGDVLALAPGVLAVGTGERTTPAGVERLARRVLSTSLAHTVFAVPIAQSRATIHLDTLCTMVDRDAMVMFPSVVDSLTAIAVRWSGDDIVVEPPRPFVTAVADALKLDRLRTIATGLHPITAEREQWDDGNNALAVRPGVVIAYARNSETNARLEAAGIEVLPIASSELVSGRGGPRCMSCPILRAPAPDPAGSNAG